MCTMPNSTPVTAWRALREGNERFVAGKPQHPSQGIERRASLAAAQTPNAVVFGCADSRVAAEIIFDQGLGDMTVVRTAGHVMGPAVLGSIEYAVTVLNVPLIVDTPNAASWRRATTPQPLSHPSHPRREGWARNAATIAVFRAHPPSLPGNSRQRTPQTHQLSATTHPSVPDADQPNAERRTSRRRGPRTPGH